MFKNYSYEPKSQKTSFDIEKMDLSKQPTNLDELKTYTFQEIS